VSRVGSRKQHPGVINGKPIPESHNPRSISISLKDPFTNHFSFSLTVLSPNWNIDCATYINHYFTNQIDKKKNKPYKIRANWVSYTDYNTCILTSPCTAWIIESPTIVELTVTTSTLSSLSIRRISQKMKLLSIPHVRMTWIAEPVSWTSIFGCASEAFKVQPLRFFFFSNSLSFFSCAIFSFVSRLFMYFIASPIWARRGMASWNN